MAQSKISRTVLQQAVKRFSPGLPQTEVEKRVSNHLAKSPRTGQERLAALGRLKIKLDERRYQSEGFAAPSATGVLQQSDDDTELS